MPSAILGDVISDCLGDMTRKERRNLLLASTVSIAISSLGLIPQKISALGIELTAPAQTKFFYLLAGVVLYFLVAFIIYGLADLLVWRTKYQLHPVAVAYAVEDENSDQAVADLGIPQRPPTPRWLFGAYRPIGILRISFDLLLPLLVGLGAIIVLILRAGDA